MVEDQSADLKIFLARLVPKIREVVIWGDLRFNVTSYVCNGLPPLEYITSVRAIVCTHQDVLLVRDPESVHIQPGGRREEGESLEQTLRREVLEETGWIIESPQLLGIKHFCHLTPRPIDYPYPYPDFLQMIYSARPERYSAEARRTDGYELSATLVPIAGLDQFPLATSERMFLQVALSQMKE
jgi:8-oxo-dGTP pyrophosphatase MutT (NUDIX family)